MKKALMILVPLLLSYLITLIATLPAAVAVRWLPLPDALQLQGLRGTLWQGEVQNIVWKTQHTGPVRWQWQGRSLLTGEVAAQVEVTDPQGIRGHGTLGWNGEWNIRDTRLYLPAALLAAPLALPVEPGGDLDARLTLLRFTDRGCIAANATLHWQQGRVRHPGGTLNLGETQIRLNCINQQWRAEINQNSPQLSSKGKLTLTGNRNYHWQSEITPGQDFSPLLMIGLSQRADKQGNGHFTVDTSGRW